LPLPSSQAARMNPNVQEATSWEANMMRRVLLIAGLLALAIGLLWIGQGTGVIKWPRESFMINEIQWAGYGVALAALGLIFIWQAKG
jgi:uncharacterized membrane protein